MQAIFLARRALMATTRHAEGSRDSQQSCWQTPPHSACLIISRVCKVVKLFNASKLQADIGIASTAAVPPVGGSPSGQTVRCCRCQGLAADLAVLHSGQSCSPVHDVLQKLRVADVQAGVAERPQPLPQLDQVHVLQGQHQGVLDGQP